MIDKVVVRIDRSNRKWFQQCRLGRYGNPHQRLENACSFGGLTQSQLAEKLGITDKAISKWETGKAMPGPSLTEKSFQSVIALEALFLTLSRLTGSIFGERGFGFRLKSRLIR